MANYYSNPPRGAVARLVIFCGVFLLTINVRCEDQDPSNKIEQGLFSSSTDKQDMIVTFGSMEEMKGIAHQITSKYKSYASKEDRIYAMYQAMSGYSTKCQGSAQSYLDSESYKYHKMWSSNTMIIRAGDQACADTLSKMNEVNTIRKDRTRPLIDPVMGSSNDNVTSPAPVTIGRSYGLAVMHVPEAWEYKAYSYGYNSYGYNSYMKGALKTGKGITVASIDTGVNAQHEALKDNFRSYAGWMDGYNKSKTPQDLVGHGSHTMGTMVGKGGIGVAPSAEWITCRGCLDFGCLDSALLSCCQWMLCPHDVYNEGPDNYKDCSTAPDLVSNSWGGGQGDKTFERCVLALRAAGIIPIFSIGNSGPKCTTANSPGDLEYVIGVGATNDNDEIVFFSSKGPSVEGKIKPDVSAPGMSIKSSWNTSSNAYKVISGTSMAAPHVSGLIALMLERCRLPYQTVLNVLQISADKDYLGKTAQICGGTISHKFPNNIYGYGRVNALEAIKRVEKLCQMNDKYRK